MPSRGDIGHKSELGLQGHGFTFYQWAKCIDCDKERWVGLRNGIIVYPRCSACCNRITAKSNPHLFHRGEHKGVEFQRGRHYSPNTEFRKGHPSGAVPKGVRVSPQTEFKKGEHRSPKTEYQRGVTNGANHPRWQGGLTPINTRERHKQDYIDWRLMVFGRDDFTCQKCGKRGVYLHAHHNKSFAEYPELRFEVSNGITYCSGCHWGLHRKQKEVK